jgi:hypothetical protein
MNKEQQELLDEAYDNYLSSYTETLTKFTPKKILNENPNYKPHSLTKEGFAFLIRANENFAKEWGLVIEERELGDDERIFIYEKELFSPLRIINQNIPVIPTKQITLTYNDKTITSYD